MNVLKSHLKQTVETMLSRGVSQREIARVLGVDPKTTRRIARELGNSHVAATGPTELAEPNSRTLATDLEGGVASICLTPATGGLSAQGQNTPEWARQSDQGPGDISNVRSQQPYSPRTT